MYAATFLNHLLASELGDTDGIIQQCGRDVDGAFTDAD